MTVCALTIELLNDKKEYRNFKPAGRNINEGRFPTIVPLSCFRCDALLHCHNLIEQVRPKRSVRSYALLQRLLLNPFGN